LRQAALPWLWLRKKKKNIWRQAALYMVMKRYHVKTYVVYKNIQVKFIQIKHIQIKKGQYCVRQHCRCYGEKSVVIKQI